MTGIKRKIDYEECQSEEQTVTCLEDLSNELIFDLFEYLHCYEFR